MKTKTPPNHRSAESPAPPSERSTLNNKGSAHPTWRHNGNVARLPKAARDKLNMMLQDGLTYPAIINNLGDDGKGLIPSNISRWKDGGHQDWLAEQAFIARTRTRQETPSDLTRDFDATDVGHAALQLGTLHVFEALRDLTSPRPSDGRGVRGEGGSGEDQSDQKRTSKLDLLLGGDSAAFARLLNALARASRETMLLQKYREACVRARQALQQLRDPNRKISEKETRAIVRVVDGILGLNSPDSDEALDPSPAGRDEFPRVPDHAQIPNEPENANGEHSLTQ